MRLLLATFLLLQCCTATRADFILRWSPSYQISSGLPIFVDLYLDETDTTFISDYGISGATYQVSLSGVGFLDTPIENTEFDDDIAPSSNGSVASVVQTSILGLTSTTNSIRIGTFSVGPTTIGLGSLEVSVLNPDIPGDVTVYTSNSFDQIILDDTPTIVQAPIFHYEFQSVPEPTSGVTAALFIAFRTFARPRRKSISGSSQRSI